MGISVNRRQNDVLSLVNCCISCLKTGGKTEDILFELLKSFEADDAVFLSSTASHQGVDLARSYVLRKGRKYLDAYADYYWKYDPLYQMQFFPDQNAPVFKTDDVIPYSQLINLDYYNLFLRPQNLLGELIIRLCSRDNVFGAISLQRRQDQPGFKKQDLLKASMFVPFLINIFEFADQITKNNNERLLLERWMEACSEGMILLDPGYQSMFSNHRARVYCQQISAGHDQSLLGRRDAEIPVPRVVVQDCQHLVSSCHEPDWQLHTNRIFDAGYGHRFYVQCFPLILTQNERVSPHFIVTIHKLTPDYQGQAGVTSSQYKLSQREETIARQAAEGLTNKQIADRLGISPFTVQNHLKNIFEKTGLDSRTKLANLVKAYDSLS
ncbi:MAG: hypothetical protein A2Z29_08970 [Chloroflexi bacterium RBG_16_56_11]|nr:MAG: hypothetical protein A2Z29_08970 [Chloroflexi bacterium RBG_16_56_11]